MTLTGKPLWLEGMFLRPQHLQQYDRWIEGTLEQRVVGLSPYAWGVRKLEFDAEALNNGQLQVTSADIVFPDGTVYKAPEMQALPPARQVTTEYQGRILYLGLPLKSAGGLEVAENGGGLQRFLKTTMPARNNAQSDRPPADILIGGLNVRLVMDGENMDELVLLPVAEIDAVDAQGHIALSDTYIAPTLNCGGSARLLSLMDQVRGLLKSRAGVLATSGAVAQGGVDRAGMLDLMTLGIVNRYEVDLQHMISTGLYTPETLYRLCLSLAGELSAYATPERRPPDFPTYNHNDLRATFEPVLAALRQMLSVVVEQNAVNIPLTEREYGIWLGEIADRMLFQGQRRFVLIAQANVALETIRTQMPIQIKVGPVEQIRELVNLQLPGIGIESLSVAPREIPFIQNAVYFELDPANSLWSQFPSSAAFALHVSGAYPGLKLELWAIQKGG